MTLSTLNRAGVPFQRAGRMPSMATPLKPPVCPDCGSDQLKQLDAHAESSGGLSSDSGIIHLRYAFRCKSCGMGFTHSEKGLAGQSVPPAKQSIKNLPEMENPGN